LAIGRWNWAVRRHSGLLIHGNVRDTSSNIFLATQHSSAWETEFHSVFGTPFRKVQINQSDEMTRKSITPELVQTLASQLDGTTLVTPDSEEYGASIARWSDTAVQNAVCCQSTHAIGSITDQRDARAQWHFLTQQKLCRNWSRSRQNTAWKLQSKEGAIPPEAPAPRQEGSLSISPRCVRSRWIQR
jgi:hypothetical protein